jgi:hypothetical protein
MTRTLARRTTGLAVLALALSCSSLGFGQAKIEMSEGRSLTIGGGLRSAYRATESSPSGNFAHDLTLESIRLYFNANLHEDFSIEANTEYDGADVSVLDAVVKYAPSEYFNIWLGRHLTPSDRANLDGPYYLSAYDYPGLVSRYPGIFAGRDNGVSVSGQVNGGKFKYAFGVYEGMTNVTAGDNMLVAARVVANLLDPEPGYYNSSTYYGDKDVFAIGFVIQHQSDVAIIGLTPTAFTGYNFDLLFEKKIGSGGVATLEGAFYDYDFEGGVIGAAGPVSEGSAFLAQGAYLFPTMVGIGKIQPLVRYQDFRDTTILDTGVNYVIRGHNARVSLFYSRLELVPGQPKTNQFTAGTQFQF